MENMAVLINFGSDFPYDGIDEIGKNLIASGSLTPGFIPPDAGLLNLESVRYQQITESLNFIILPDLNLISELCSIADIDKIDRTENPLKIAINMMAFAQAMDIPIEPSIAFHEFAHRHGNEKAHEKLSWFRAADKGSDAFKWIDLALERSETIAMSAPEARSNEDLALPLKRWNRNYIVALKIAELELQKGPHLDRYQKLLDWMIKDFILAGPAAIYGALYLAPNAKRKGLFKQLRSDDRNKAIQGIKNAAWDMTHLSDFVKRIEESNGSNNRYIFATADKLLAKIAPVLLLQPTAHDGNPSLYDAFQCWWPDNDDAKKIVDKILDFIKSVDATDTRKVNSGKQNTIEQMIADGEKHIRNWKRDD